MDRNNFKAPRLSGLSTHARARARAFVAARPMPPLTAPRRIDARFIARATGPRAIVTAGNFAKAALEISARVL